MVALLTGPLVLFPITAENINFTREQLLSAKPLSESEWIIKVGESNIYLKPFMHIKDETYRLYNKVISA